MSPTQCFSASSLTARAGARPAQRSAAGRRAAAPTRRGASLVVRADLDPDNASFLVCGGGGVALEITRQLKDMGSWVWQLQRTDVRRRGGGRGKQIEGMMAIVAKGDAMDAAGVDKVMAGIDGLDAVVSTIGGTSANPSADSLGNINLMEAAVRAGVKKFVLVTSIGTGDSKDATPPNVYEVLRPLLLEKEKAEQRLKARGRKRIGLELGDKMDFVIVRPGGLKTEPATGKARARFCFRRSSSGVLTEDTSVCGSITRADVATLTMKAREESLLRKNRKIERKHLKKKKKVFALLKDAANGKVLSAVDREQLFGEPQFEEFKL
eukprot:scaffold8.g1674.t1